ncbi:transforming growth factor beta-induced factor (TGIF) transcription factor [Oopsacas minuta]|uniref:Transforming growth factor beta-induced factor (TGIF) transcription factor n=1 Tax=Oopsacas minuta TaxID=111878 RepID=A0AAV7KJT2_9METZ|nr:transforming growth factor beta-induced factor (TGIF) transcription factor [Oopsacas minuta]
MSKSNRKSSQVISLPEVNAPETEPITVELDELEYQGIIERLAASQKIKGTRMLKQYYDSTLNSIIEKEGQLIAKAKATGSKSKKQLDKEIAEEIHLHSLEIDKKRRDLRPQKKTILVNWLNAHPNSPYPKEDDKQRLADESGLTVKQVSIWFANQRRKMKENMKRKTKLTPPKAAKTPKKAPNRKKN